MCIRDRLNIRCYLQHIGITHNCIDVNTVSINPANHWVWLFGGWWYARSIGETMTALPSNLINVIPDRVIQKKKSDFIVDGEQIRALCRKMLKPNAPQAMIDWANFPSNKNAVEELRNWRESVLSKSFGGIKFVEYDVSFNDIYGN